MAQSIPNTVGQQTQSASSTQSNADAVDFTATIQDAVQENQPICVVAVLAHLDQARLQDTGSSQPDQAEIEAVVGESLRERLEVQRRRYDTVTQIDSASFLLLIRTLADASILEARLTQISDYLAQPHQLATGSATVPVHLGAVIRQPNETAEQIKSRMLTALRQAQVGDGRFVLLT